MYERLIKTNLNVILIYSKLRSLLSSYLDWATVCDLIADSRSTETRRAAPFEWHQSGAGDW